jgi:mono/diheme cytochrome c family protein
MRSGPRGRLDRNDGDERVSKPPDDLAAFPADRGASTAPLRLGRAVLLAGATAALCAALPSASWTQTGRPSLDGLRTPIGATREQLELGDRVFHGEAAGGKCSECHGWDAKGTGNGNDLTTGMWIWGDGSLRMIKARIEHGLKVAPGMDGDLTPADVEAVSVYVWGISHQTYP